MCKDPKDIEFRDGGKGRNTRSVRELRGREK